MNDSTSETLLEDGGDAELLADRYRLHSRLGEGAMGEVYSAEHVLMRKQVAIKVLRREMSEDEEIVARFHREARAAAALDHPNVCQATDFGQNDEGAFFLVMEYLEGRTLQDLIDSEGCLGAKRALHIARQIAAALEVAHSQGIVHRDLKPENTMLIERQGDPDFVKIMDFGIARLVSGSDDDDEEPATRLTRQGMIYGTPHYMSPEQVAGSDVDARTDLYALGVVLFEMLTGQPPFDGDNIARVMGKHVTEPIPALNARCPEITFAPALEELVGRLLAKDADNRPDSAGEVIAALDALDGRLEAPKTAPSTDDKDPIADITQTMSAVTRETGRKSVQFWKRLPVVERGVILALVAFVFLFTSLVAGGLLLYTFMDDDDRQAEAIEADRQSLLDDELVAAAIEAAKQGSREELDSLIEEHPDDAHLRFLSLQADKEAGRSIDWVKQAQLLFDLDGRYANEPILVEPLVDQLTSANNEEARKLLADHLTSTVRSVVAERARTGTPRATRDAAYKFLEDEGELRNLEDWERVAAEMRQARCPSLSEHLEELVAIGNPEAIPTIEAYQRISTRGCGRSRMRDCIGCIRGDLAPAIRSLQED